MNADNFTKIVLAVIVLLMSALWFGFIAKYGVTAENQNLVNQVTIAVIGFDTLVLGYFFGSSSGSAAKDRTINQQLTGTGGGTTPSPDPKVSP